MNKVKEICAGVVAGIMTITLSAFAETEKIDITDFEVKDGIVSVELMNTGEKNTIFTVILEKTGAEGRIYAVYDKEMRSNEKVEFSIPIPGEIQGVKASGSYVLKVQNSERERLEKNFDYASNETVDAFIHQLKEEADKVTDSEKAYELILPLFQNPDNSGVLFTIGLDSSLFTEIDTDVRQDAVNILYNNNINELTAENLSEKVLSAFGLASYNNGEKSEAIDILSPTYNGMSVDSSYKTDVIAMMEDSYKGTNDFVEGFKEAYGIETVNRATTGEMEEALDVFVEETDLFESEVDKIKNLSNKRKAYEYMVLKIDNKKLNSVEELQALLKEAYNKAKESGKSSGSSGGGGGGGSVSNSIKPTSGSVTGAKGSGTFEEKVETAVNMIFTDMDENHWAAESVLWLKDKGIVNGTDKGAFEPDREVTREEFTKMLVLTCRLENGVKDLSFTDVSADEWYAPYIATAVENGIVKGIDEESFGIGRLITREDMAVMIDRAAAVAGISLESIKEYLEFADSFEISDYAAEAIETLYSAGVVNGKGNNKFEPKSPATRAEAAKIICGAFKGGF